MSPTLTETGALTELEQFHPFIGEAIKDGGRRMLPEESLREVREYQRELDRCRRELQPAYERSLREQGRVFNADELKARVKARLAERGLRS